MKTYVYVDGFNLYYGCIKGTKYKWLDLGKLCSVVLPGHTVLRIKYFTARVHPSPQNPEQGIRQAAYLRALRTIPNLEIYEGHFLSHPRWRQLAVPGGGRTSLARNVAPGVSEYFDVPEGAELAYVWDPEEKGSDVNLAAELLVDGFRGRYEFALVVSNDSDLVAPIRIVREELDLPVGVLNPHAKRPSRELGRVATFQRTIWKSSLRKSQFPPELMDERGIITKPTEW